jgi:hypothetical protein
MSEPTIHLGWDADERAVRRTMAATTGAVHEQLTRNDFFDRARLGHMLTIYEDELPDLERLAGSDPGPPPEATTRVDTELLHLRACASAPTGPPFLEPMLVRVCRRSSTKEVR